MGNSKMIKTVTLRWLGPYNLEQLHVCNREKKRGIYAISRIWGGKETLLYIGRTKRDIKQRLKEHLDWINEYRGQIQIRFGSLYNQKYSPELLAEVESLLIILHNTVENTVNTRTCFIKPLRILGKRGKLKKVLDSEKMLEDCK